MQTQVLPKVSPGDVLIITDMQNDFLPGGRLAVAHADMLIPILNNWIEHFVRASLPVIASRDWHPENHSSFKQFGGLWPPHCIKNTKGADFSSLLKLPKDVYIISKATEKDKEAYSAFIDTGLNNLLVDLAIKHIFIGGLVTEYCILNTVLDALKLNYQVTLITEGIMSLNIKPGDGERAVKVMVDQGAKLW